MEGIVMCFTHSRFNGLLERIRHELKKSKNEYEKIEQSINNDLADDFIDQEEARYEASLRFLDLSQKVLCDLQQTEEIINQQQDMGLSPVEILNTAREWYGLAKDYYKCVSDYYFYFKEEFRQESCYLKREMENVEKEIEALALGNSRGGDIRNEMYG
jgi:neutral trehalase